MNILNLVLAGSSVSAAHLAKASVKDLAIQQTGVLERPGTRRENTLV